jgi:hypothetical protein
LVFLSFGNAYVSRRGAFEVKSCLIFYFLGMVSTIKLAVGAL